MLRLICTTLYLLAAAPTAQAQFESQTSHIQANVPDASQFDGFLRRDLLAYFKASGQARADRVEFKLLREAPTQSGVAYPKYYVWARAYGGSALLLEGAVRTAAIDRVRFEVTDFVSKEGLRQNDGRAEQVFPAALVSQIKQLAAKP